MQNLPARKPGRSASATLIALLVGGMLVVPALDPPPSTAQAADDTVIRIETGDVVRTIRIDPERIARALEDALDGFDHEAFARSLEQALDGMSGDLKGLEQGLEGLGDEIAAALEGLDCDYDVDRGYGYRHQGRFDGEEFGRRMAEFGERMAEQQVRIAERVRRAVERGERAHGRSVVRIERQDRLDAANEEQLQREIRRLERRLERLKSALEELETSDSTGESERGSNR